MFDARPPLPLARRFDHARLRTALLVGLGAALGACESTDRDPDADEDRGNVPLLDANNYSSQSSLSISTVETASATDLDICWSDIMNDIQCHDLAPEAEIDNVALLRFLHLSEEDVEEKLTSGQLAQSEIDGYLEYNTTNAGTCAKLSSMSFFGTAIDIQEEYVESDDHTYLILFAEGTTPGVGARTMVFVEPTASSTNTQVDGPSGCGVLDFSADLSSAQTVAIPNDGPWVVDWRDITKDGQGNEIVFESIDGVLLGHYEGMTVAELQEQILDLELIATDMWEIELSGGRTADLANARHRGDQGTFQGFDGFGDGVWLVALMCSTCQNPAPIVLSILDPGTGG